MKVVVGMSGGVDSSVAAFLLKKQGYDVIGMFMKNWEEEDEDGVCKSSKEYEDALRVCEQIGIPCYTVNFSEKYWDNVFAECLEDYKKGYTPNPDVLCNREIKFKALLEKAIELGGDVLATGHYCQVGSNHTLVKGKDPNKDQTYFLYTVKDAQLAQVLFPIGRMEKPEVRKIAQKEGFVTADKKDSTGICFIGKRNFKQFLNKFIDYAPGNFERINGEVVGKHDGISFYTIGQRRGLAIGGPGEAWFVVGKDVSRNVVFVEQGEDHPALYSTELVATDLSFVNTRQDLSAPYDCFAKVRYRQKEEPCTIERIEGGKAYVTFHKPQRAVTPRQSVVFYDGDVCLGGGMIA